MNASFGEWYRKAKIQPRNEDLVARTKAIEVFMKKVDEKKIAELVRRFVNLPSKDNDVMNGLTKELLAMDAAFQAENNDIEMQVLSGSALATLFEQPSTSADFAALLLISAAAQGFRKAPVVPDIVQLAREYLFNRSRTLRSIETRRKVVGANLDKLIESAKSAAATNSATQMQQPLEAVLKGLSETINNVATFTENAVQMLERADGVLLEESNVVWWVFGGFSRDVSTRFSELLPGFAAALAGKELADLTRIIPGHRAAPAYLDKQLEVHRNKKLTLNEFIEQISQEWIVKFKPAKDMLDLAPISFLLSSVADGLDARAAVQLAKKNLNVSSGAVDT